LFPKQAIDVSNNIFMKIDTRLDELICQDIRFDISYVNEILDIIYNDVQTHNEHTLSEYKFTLPTTYRAMIMNHVVQYITVINIRKEKFEDAINRRTTNNTMVKIKVTKEQSDTGTKRQAINKALHKHLKLEQNEPH
jgi:hypothetical protein